MKSFLNKASDGNGGMQFFPRNGSGLLLPKSILFVPADRQDLISKAVLTDADGICLDLEDGVVADRKQLARDNLDASSKKIETAKKELLVRVNSEIEEIGRDITSLPCRCSGVVLAKSGGHHHVHLLNDAIDRLCKNSPNGGPYIIASVEDPLALQSFDKYGQMTAPRLQAFFFGMEDMALALNCEPGAPLAVSAFLDLALCASRQRLNLLGYPSSIADFKDLERFRLGVTIGRDAGAVGGFCIHPDQVKILNDVFNYTEDQKVFAKEIIDAFEIALEQGKAVTSANGKMIDRPVYERARKFLKK